jgi:hypothetical protein
MKVTLYENLYKCMIKNEKRFRHSCRENQSTLFLFSNFFFFRKSFRLWDMWQNIVEPDMSQMTIWSTRFACWIPKATNIHSEYVTHCFSSNLFFRKSFLLRDMWQNIVEPNTSQMTIWSTRFACWIPKATNTHSEYVTLVAFPVTFFFFKILSVCEICGKIL